MKRALERWSRGPQRPRIGEGELHIWRMCLDLSPELEHRLAKTLHPDERSRAERFAFPQLRHRFLAGRGLLRGLLASYLDDSPENLEFRTGQHGKPHLVGGAAHESLSFNFSNCRELGLVAISLNCRVGVDIEWIRADLDWMELASRFFSRRELAILEQLPPGEQAKGFFTYWTCKEAWVKAKGGGLSTPLDRFEVQLSEDQRSGKVLVSDGADASVSWSLFRPCVAVGFAGAVASDRPDPKTSLWAWSDPSVNRRVGC